MKLLTWMHRKIRQNNSEMFREFPHGQAIVNSHNLYPKQAHGGISLVQPPRESCRRRSFACSQESRGVDEPGRDSSTEFSESFHGFLAIGTLGAETYVSDPAEMPALVTCVDNIAERETEATQSELELINEELEKVLAAEEARVDDGWTDSSRSSHASTNARSSSTSTGSLSRKSVEATEGNETGRAATCPLQGYLFGSGVELPGRRSTARKNRASLGELFQRHRAEETSGAKQPHKDGGDKASTNLMKKILRKKFSSAAAAEPTDYPSDTKFHKMLHIFHKKVHPESSTDIEKLDAQSRSSVIKVIADADKSPGGDEGLPGVCDDYKSQSTSTDGDSARNRGLWIKTDADYLVLEL